MTHGIQAYGCFLAPTTHRRWVMHSKLFPVLSSFDRSVITFSVKSSAFNTRQPHVWPWKGCPHLVPYRPSAYVNILVQVSVSLIDLSSNLQSTRVGDTTWHLCGDNQGWIYTRQIPGTQSVNDIYRWTAEPIMRSSDPVRFYLLWHHHHSIGKDILYICVRITLRVCLYIFQLIVDTQNKRRISCLGPGKVSVQNMLDPECV